MGFPGGAEVKASACNMGDPGLIPVSGRSPGEGNGNPLQYSCLENSMVVGAVGADGFRFVQNNGEAANQAVPHVHVHVIPVMMEDKGRYGGRMSFSPEEMESTAQSIRAELRDNLG